MSHIRRMGYLLMLLIGAALLTAMVWRTSPPPPFVGLTTQQIPRHVGGYSAPQDYQMPPAVLTALSTADIVSRTYQQSGQEIDFVLLGGTSRDALHDPRSCLTGAGWLLAGDHTEHLPGTTADVHACHAVGLPGSPGFDILYLYVIGGRRISSIGDIRRQMLWTAMLGRKNEPVYMLRFMEPLTDDPQAQAGSHARMIAFAAHMWTVLQPELSKS
jgi:EpsI family protein